MRKYWQYIIIVVQILIIGSLIKSIVTTLTSGKRVDDLLQKKASLVKKQQQIAEKLKETESKYYLEKVAREQLHLVQPGETVVMLPDNVATGELKVERQEKQKTNWEKWEEIFFGEVF